MPLQTVCDSIDKATYMSIVGAATMAPSADNNQPWRIEIVENSISFFLDTTRLIRSDVDHMFDLTSIGAAIENAKIAANQLGYDAQVELLNARDVSNEPVARLHLGGGGRSSLPGKLFEAIHSRCTNRKQFARTRLSPMVRRELDNLSTVFPDVRLDWIENPKQLRQLGRLVAYADSLRFASPAFHDEFYAQLRVSGEEVEQSRDGLDVKTLELPVGGQLFLRCFQNRVFANLFKLCSGTRLMAMPSAQAVCNSSAVVAFSVPNRSTSSFLTGGQAIQRFWLTATSLGLAVHPLGSLPIFITHRTASGETQPYAKTLSQNLMSLCPQMGGNALQLLLRIGYTEEPCARSLRRHASAVSQFVEEKQL